MNLGWRVFFISGWGSRTQYSGSGGGGGVIDTTDRVLSLYSEASAVSPGIPTIVGSYTVGETLTHLMNVEFGGTNIARFYLTLNSVTIAQYITWFSGPLNGTWDFRALNGGLPVVEGDQLIVSVTHERPWAGDFYLRLNMLLIVDPPPA